MSHILKRKINNVIYVYQEKSYRDELGRPRTKQKCLGKLDNNGVLILSRKRNPKNLPAAITKYKLIITKFRVKPITDSRKESKANKESKTQSHNNARKTFTNSHKVAQVSQYTNSHELAHYRPSYTAACKLARQYLNMQTFTNSHKVVQNRALSFFIHDNMQSHISRTSQHILTN